MKNIIIAIVCCVAIITCVILVQISDKNIASNEVASFNKQFEGYEGKKIYGTDVLTLINKAIDNNEKYEIERDGEGNFIENDENSLRVIITFLTTTNNNEVVEKTHPMEALEKRGLNDFISSFSITNFECTSIEYNSVGRVSKIMVKQLEL